MVHLFQCSSVHTRLLLSFSILLLLVTPSMELAFSDARSLPLRPIVPQDTGGGTDKAVSVTADDNKQEEEAAAARSSRGGEETEAGRQQRRRALIGSRPPRCERVCMSCGHCEAVQVPIVPQEEKKEEREEEEKARAAAAADAAVTQLTAAMFTYRVDGITNYKPLSWKCRCGDTILDP